MWQITVLSPGPRDSHRLWLGHLGENHPFAPQHMHGACKPRPPYSPASDDSDRTMSPCPQDTDRALWAPVCARNPLQLGRGWAAGYASAAWTSPVGPRVRPVAVHRAGGDLPQGSRDRGLPLCHRAQALPRSPSACNRAGGGSGEDPLLRRWGRAGVVWSGNAEWRGGEGTVWTRNG